MLTLIFFTGNNAFAYKLEAEETLINFFSNPANTADEDWSDKPLIDLWNRVGGESAQYADGNFTTGDRWTTTMPESIQAIYNDLSRSIFRSVRAVNTGFAYDYSYYSESSRVHEGLDIDAPEGTTVRSATAGSIVNMVPAPEETWVSDNVFIFIKEEGTDRIWIYGHLQDGKVKIGDTVNEGSVLGKTNSSNHLHLAVYSESAHSYSPYYDWPKSRTSASRYAAHVAEMLENRCSPLYAFWLYKNSLPSRCASPASGPDGRPEHVISVAIVIDVSGSMRDQWADGIKIDSAKTAALELLDLLETENNREGQKYQVSLIEFAFSANVVQQLTSDYDLLRQRVENLSVGGGTNIGDGIEKALFQLDGLADDLSYIVFLSDGMSNQGRSPQEIKDWLRRRYSPDWVDLQASVYGFNYGDGVDTRSRTRDIEGSLLGAGYTNTRLFTHFTDSNRPVRDIALERVPDDLLFSFNGHANNGVLGFGEERICLNNIRDLNFTEMSLAVLAGCKTAGEVENCFNITETFVNSGSKAAIGYSDYVNNRALQPWLVLYFSTVLNEADPLNVLEAFYETNSNYTFHEYQAKSSGDRYRLEPQIYLCSLDPVYLILPKDARDEDAGDLPKIYTVGFGDPGDLDEDLLRSIALISSGEYFYGNEAFDLSNTFTLAQHMATGQVIGQFSGTIAQDQQLEAGSFEVDSAATELRVGLNWPGSQIDLTLIDPSGRTVSENYPELELAKTTRPAYWILKNPKEGSWTVQLLGSDIPGEASPYYVVASTSSLTSHKQGFLLEFLMTAALASLITLLLAPGLTWDPDSRRRFIK